MKHYAGLDVSLEETSVCILDETGKICREVKVTSHPEDLLRIRPGTWTGLGSRRVSSRSGSSTGWPTLACLLFGSRHATPKPF